jgi:hypothetical protein
MGPICPQCRRQSLRIHIHYRRTLADLPWEGIPVRIELRTRRFFRYAVLNRKPKAIKVSHSLTTDKKHSVVITLSEADYRQARSAAKTTKQTVAAWIADMVYTSTQP